MPISGLVLSLTADARLDDLVAELGHDPHIDVGTASRRRLPLVLDTADPGEDRALWEWIRSRSGVIHVDVTFIHFDEPLPADLHTSAIRSNEEARQL